MNFKFVSRPSSDVDINEEGKWQEPVPIAKKSRWLKIDLGGANKNKSAITIYPWKKMKLLQIYFLF